MSDKFSIGHILGLGLTVGSIVASIVQYNSRTSPGPSVDFNLLGAPPGMQVHEAVISPAKLAVFDTFEWSDSFPFQAEALAAHGIRFITVERYRLPENKALMESDLDLGPETGNRDLLVEYSFDPKSRRIRHFRRKAFPANVPGLPVVVGDYESIAYIESDQPSYPELDRVSSRGGHQETLEGHWRIGRDSLPIEFSFNGREARKFYHEANGWACINVADGNSIEIVVSEAGLKESMILQKALKIKESAMAQAGVSTVGTSRVVEAHPAIGKPRRTYILDPSGKVEQVITESTDSLGRITARTEFDRVQGDTAATTNFEYGSRGELAKVVKHSKEVEEIHQFRYTQSGWPERLLHYKRGPNGQIRIISRTFFKFRQQ